MIRKIELLIVAVVLVLAAFSTGFDFLFYLLYLAILVIGGSYVLVRLGLTDLEAGYAVSQLHGHVGDRMRVTYTLRNGSRFPKPWLEIHNPTSTPVVVHPDRVRLRTADGIALPTMTWGAWQPVEVAGNQTKTVELRFQNRASLRCAAPLQLQTAGSLTAQERPLRTAAIAFTPVATR